jgi:hypothetical protein
MRFSLIQLLPTSVTPPSPRSDRFSCFFGGLNASSCNPVFPLLLVCRVDTGVGGEGFAWPLTANSPFAWPVIAFISASSNGINVSFRRADRCRFALGGLIESSLTLRCRRRGFLREAPFGPAMSGENIAKDEDDYEERVGLAQALHWS